MFYFFYRIIYFRLNKEKDDIRETQSNFTKTIIRLRLSEYLGYKYSPDIHLLNKVYWYNKKWSETWEIRGFRIYNPKG